MPDGLHLVFTGTPNTSSNDRLVVRAEGKVIACPNAFPARSRCGKGEGSFVWSLVGREADVAVDAMLAVSDTANRDLTIRSFGGSIGI
jgi:hypothetical protein